jgi:succinate dehydrogenase/fumarate reductase flavoprotein subunit
MLMATASAQVLVVGGGAAGLTAAYFAAQAGAKVRSCSVTYSKGVELLYSSSSSSSSSTWTPLTALQSRHAPAVDAPNEA